MSVGRVLYTFSEVCAGTDPLCPPDAQIQLRHGRLEGFCKHVSATKFKRTANNANAKVPLAQVSISEHYISPAALSLEANEMRMNLWAQAQTKKFSLPCLFAISKHKLIQRRKKNRRSAYQRSQCKFRPESGPRTAPDLLRTLVLRRRKGRSLGSQRC